MPVNADIAALEAFFVDEHDPHVNPLGVKGLAELAVIGASHRECGVPCDGQTCSRASHHTGEAAVT
jgi:hypothetical protein